MKVITGTRAAEMCCNVAGAVSVLIIAGSTVAVSHQNLRLVHSSDEMDYMALVLNVAMPAALLALTASATIKTWRKNFHLLSFVLIAGVFLVVSACALAMYGGYVAAHPSANLWSRIWWCRLAS